VLLFKELKELQERRALTVHREHLVLKVLKELLAHKDFKERREH
jgi:hypothetical protein